MGNLLTWELFSWQRWQSLAAECCVDALINRKLTRRGKCGIKTSTSSLNDHNRERIARKSNFRNLEKLQKEWTESGVNASRATTNKHLQEWSYSSSWTRDSVKNILLGIKKKELDFGLTVENTLYRWKWFSFYFLVLCQGHTVWRKCRGTESKVFEVQCVVSAVCGGLGCHVICWCCSWFYQQKDFRGLHASFCCQTSWRCQYHFPTGLSTSLYCQNS